MVPSKGNRRIFRPLVPQDVVGEDDGLVRHLEQNNPNAFHRQGQRDRKLNVLVTFPMVRGVKVVTSSNVHQRLVLVINFVPTCPTHEDDVSGELRTVVGRHWRWRFYCTRPRSRAFVEFVDTNHRAPSTEHRAPSTEHQAPSIDTDADSGNLK